MRYRLKTEDALILPRHFPIEPPRMICGAQDDRHPLVYRGHQPVLDERRGVARRHRQANRAVVAVRGINQNEPVGPRMRAGPIDQYIA